MTPKNALQEAETAMSVYEWIEMTMKDYQKINNHDEAHVCQYILDHAPWDVQSQQQAEREAEIVQKVLEYVVGEVDNIIKRGVINELTINYEVDKSILNLTSAILEQLKKEKGK